MSTHIGAEPGQIAPTVLLPGDPLRARWIAETFLDDATCYSEVRGMLGFTGTWHGQPVSVQGSGMGQPSMSIYVNELFQDYDVRRIVRVGSCGALTERLAVRDVVIASGACTDSSLNRLRFHGLDYAAVADFGLLRAAHDAAAARDDVTAHVGLIFSGDSFYSPRPELMKPMVEHGVLAVEMEACGALHAGRVLRTQGAGDLHGERPHRHRRGDHVTGTGADLRRDGRHRPDGRARRRPSSAQALIELARGASGRSAVTSGAFRVSRRRRPTEAAHS